MSQLPACEYWREELARDAGLGLTCYKLRGNKPAAWRHGSVFTVDPSIRRSEGALSEIRIPAEPLLPGPVGKLFAVDATDFASSLTRSLPNLDGRTEDGFAFDQGDPESHCRNAYFVAMATYEAFRRGLGRPVPWAFWGDGHYAPLRIRPFAFEGINAYYDREAVEIALGFGGPERAIGLANDKILRFTALSSDVVAHEVTHALLDGLRPGYDFPVHPDVFAFHEALADLVALFSRFERPTYFGHLVRETGIQFLGQAKLVSLAPELGRIVRKSGLRTLDVDWVAADREQRDLDLRLYSDASPRPHKRGGLLSSAVFEAFMRSLQKRIEPLVRLAAPSGTAMELYLLEQVQKTAARTASHFLSICIRAIDYCPPAAIEFPDYLRALITADRHLAPDDRYGYREELIDAFRARGIYPETIDVVSESELLWGPPEIPVYPIPGVALSDLRYSHSPAIPVSANETIRWAEAIALAIDADRQLYRELGLGDPSAAGRYDRIAPPRIASVRPTLRTGPDGYIDYSMIVEIIQDREVQLDGGARVRHRGGATLILDATGKPSLIVRQRIDNKQRLDREITYTRQAIKDAILTRDGDQYVVSRSFRRRLCASQ